VPGYIGFDATAPSLHIGSLVQIMMLRRLQHKCCPPDPRQCWRPHWRPPCQHTAAGRCPGQRGR
jgi:hypothetical protein